MGAKRSASAAFESVKVAVRCRPFSTAELGTGSKSVVQCVSSRRQVQLQQAGAAAKEFTFDAVLSPDSTQEEVRAGQDLRLIWHLTLYLLSDRAR